VIHVTVPSTRRVTSPGLVIRSSGRINEARQPNRDPPRTSVEETVLDLAQLATTLDEVCGWITKACGRRLTTEAKLRAALELRKKMRWRDELADILAAAGDGIHSVLEYRYLRDVERAHGLPRSRHQVRVVIDGKVAYRDVYYEEYQLAVELDGRTAHPDDERWRDSRRDNQPGREGWRPPATAGVTSTPAPARPRCCRRRSCGPGAGAGPRGRAQRAAR
jgi:hypothetical protein